MRYICTAVVAIGAFCVTGTSLGDFWGSELTASDGASVESFGHSVAMDGDTCVIGAYGTGSTTGSAYIFTSDASGNWSQVAELAASDGVSNDHFGYSVAIDGDTCVIGAPGTNAYVGSAYIFTSDASGNWSQVAKLTASDGNLWSNRFGNSVAIDGDTCMIGTQITAVVHIFTPDASGNWSQVAELEGGLGLGSAIAIDGDTCVIGAAGFGKAYIFKRNAMGVWTQVIEFTVGGAEQFGSSVAIDGDSCVIGAYGTNSNAGSAYIYTLKGVWNHVASLAPIHLASNDYFGCSVAIDGDTCVIGAYGTNSSAGSAYIYTSDAGGIWSGQPPRKVAELTASDEANIDGFGYSVAIDGDTCVIGAPWTINGGSAYVYGSTAAEIGACCVNSGSGCFDGTDVQCTATGGAWLGEGGSCDDCPAPCPADILGEGQVDIYDLLYLLKQWGPCP